MVWAHKKETQELHRLKKVEKLVRYAAGQEKEGGTKTEVER